MTTRQEAEKKAERAWAEHVQAMNELQNLADQEKRSAHRGMVDQTLTRLHELSVARGERQIASAGTVQRGPVVGTTEQQAHRDAHRDKVNRILYGS